MPEMGLSGSEGGAGFNPRLLPLSLRNRGCDFGLVGRSCRFALP
jgi:hypothetical protein